MERIELEVFSEAGNFSIVRPCGRKFPGSVVQGDSLSILYSCAEAIRKNAVSLGNEDLLDNAEELARLIGARLMHYQGVLDLHGIELPFNRVEFADA